MMLYRLVIIIAIHGYIGLVGYVDRIGIELNEQIPNGNNGSINDHSYFQCKDHSGFTKMK